MLSTNLMLNLRTGNLLVDTVLSLCLASMVVYLMQCKQFVFGTCRRWMHKLMRKRYNVRYQGRIYSSRFQNEGLSETFVALKQWVVAGIRKNEFVHAHTLCEIQLPRSMTMMMNSIAPDEALEGVEMYGLRHTFNRSMMVLDQQEAIQHTTHDLCIRHESYTNTGGKDDDDFSGKRSRNEYTEHTLILSSNTLTTNEIVALVEREVLKPFQSRRHQREKGKLFYYLFDNHTADEETPSYERYEWTSTKRLDHVVSEHTETLRRRVDHFLTNRDWYASHGKPYSLTVLLYGPPGCGKTSLIKAVANYTGRSIKEIPLPRVKSRQTLMEIFHGDSVGFKRVKPQDCIYVFEEFDKMGDIVKEDSADEVPAADSANVNKQITKAVHEALRGSPDGSSNKRVGYTSISDNNPSTSSALSLGDILNVMDGLLENNGIITFFTANRIDNLHKAITRPGRIDMKLKMDKATTASVKTILSNVYGSVKHTACSGTATTASVHDAIDAISDADDRYDRRWSPAEVEEICFQEPTVEGALSVLEAEVCDA